MSDSGGLPVTPDPADLRFGGEEVVDRVDLGEATVAVTTHRVLVSTPTGPGRRFRSVYRPNVTGVRRDVETDEAAGRRALQAGAYALVLSAGGFFLDLDGLVAGVNLSGTGELGGAAAVVEGLLSLLVLLDDALLGVGLLVGAVAVGFAGIYVWRRDRTFRIEIAGGEPISLPPGGDETALADQLRAAVREAPLPDQ